MEMTLAAWAITAVLVALAMTASGAPDMPDIGIRVNAKPAGDSLGGPLTSQSGCPTEFDKVTTDKNVGTSGAVSDSRFSSDLSEDACGAWCAGDCRCYLWIYFFGSDCYIYHSTGITITPTDNPSGYTYTYGVRKSATVTGDPLIVGGNNRVFYFTGQPDTDFCLVSDANLQVNTHFIARSATPREKEMTWVGALSILTAAGHAVELKVGRYATWDGSLKHLEIAYNGESVELEIGESVENDGMTITRTKNNVADVSLPGVLHLNVRAAEVSKRLWTPTDCFVHLELDFKGLHLTENAHGILGQTYRSSAKALTDQDRPYDGTAEDYITSSLWATDCKFNQYGAAASEAFNPIATIAGASRRLRASAVAEEKPSPAKTMLVHGMVVDLENTVSVELDTTEPRA